MKQKKALISFLIVPIFLAGCFLFAFSAKADEYSGTFTITSVDNSDINNGSDQTITIHGTGFTSGLKVAIYDNNYGVVRNGNDLTALVSNFVSDTEITATIPASTIAGQYDLWVYENTETSYYVKDGAIHVNPEISTDTSVLYFNSSKSAKAKINITYKGAVFSNKRWVKVRSNGKNIPILKITRSENDSTVKLNLNFRNWQAQDYDIILNYKNRIRQRYEKKNRIHYRNVWEKGTITADSIFSIRQQPM